MKKQIFTLAVLLLAVPGLSRAATKNSDWQHAKNLGDQPAIATEYDVLGATASVRYYRFDISSPTRYQIDLDIDGTQKNVFEPRVVVFRPDSVTVGPALPVLQPPSTIAMVYGAQDRITEHEGPWLSLINHRLHSDIDFPKTGTYYIAVYNAGNIGGPFRITLTEGDHELTWSQAAVRWIRTGLWVGAQWWNVLVPFIGATVAAFFWYIIHRVPHPSKRYAKKR
jgi:hypothetical protein